MLRASLTPRALVPARALASRRARARPSHSSAAASVVSRSAADSIFSRSRFPRDGRARVVVSANAVSAPDAPLRPPAVPSHVIQLAAAVAAPAPAAPAKITLGLKALLGGLATILLAVFTACIAGFLVAVREMVRACREATIASRSVANACAERQPGVLVARETLVQADSVPATTPRFSAAAVRPFRRRLASCNGGSPTLPNTASRTLMEAITRQYSSLENPADPSSRGGAWVGRRPRRDRRRPSRVNASAPVDWRKVGILVPDRANRFRVGEYCAVPRNDQTYTWGVIELNDDDYSVEKSSDDDDAGLSCDWPPQDPAIPRSAASGRRGYRRHPGYRGDVVLVRRWRRGRGEGCGGSRRVVRAGRRRGARTQAAYTAEGYLREVTGLTTVEEGVQGGGRVRHERIQLQDHERWRPRQALSERMSCLE